jgi:superoxide reductase
MEIFKCSICGNIVDLINNQHGTLVCCGKPMDLMIPNTVDAALEKHIPIINCNDNNIEIRIGEVIHPFVEEHYIDFVIIEYGNSIKRIKLDKNQEPIVNINFNYKGDINVYAYCNIHGLWKTSKNIK